MLSFSVFFFRGFFLFFFCVCRIESDVYYRNVVGADAEINRVVGSVRFGTERHGNGATNSCLRIFVFVDGRVVDAGDHLRDFLADRLDDGRAVGSDSDTRQPAPEQVLVFFNSDAVVLQIQVLRDELVLVGNTFGTELLGGLRADAWDKQEVVRYVGVAVRVHRVFRDARAIGVVSESSLR